MNLQGADRFWWRVQTLQVRLNVRCEVTQELTTQKFGGDLLHGEQKVQLGLHG
jgi:hypothetical protein